MSDEATATAIETTTQTQVTTPFSTDNVADTTGLDIARERNASFGVDTTDTPLPDPGVGDPWQISETLAGDGSRPDWFKADKYKSIFDQAKAYSELEKKLGNTNTEDAPENYEIDVRENLEQAGMDVDLESPVMLEFEKFARESKMSNDQFNECINFYLDSIHQEFTPAPEAIEQHKQDEIGKLGDEGPQIVAQLKNWGENNLNAEEFAIMQEFGDTADKVMFLKKFINSSSAPTGVPTELTGQSAYTRDDIKSMMADPKYAVDINYTKKVDDKFKELYANNRL